MAAKFTRGPWFVRRQLDPERPNGWMLPHYWRVESVEGRWVADFPRLIPEAQEQQEADIFLIASAPKLLQAVLSALELLDQYADVRDSEDGPIPNAAMSLADDLRRVIAKALGEAK